MYELLLKHIEKPLIVPFKIRSIMVTTLVMRRAQHRLSSVNIHEDKKSGEYKLSHHIDLKSGFYNGKKILDI